MQDFKLYDWNEIRDSYKYESLILGNGASIAIDKCFRYDSLFKKAAFTGRDKKIFEEIDTVDFELVLNKLRQTSIVNKILAVGDENKPEDAYKNIRQKLIETVKTAHVDYSKACVYLHYIRMFMSTFKNIVSLNYDLIIYWAMMAKHPFGDKLEFKDCFLNGEFDGNWERFYDPKTPGNKVILVFYPHGNLILATDNEANEYKIKTNFESDNLLDAILKNWNDKNGVPLFVSEGDSKQKKKAIKRNFYLSVIYDEVLRKLGSHLVIYGWSIEWDDHIVERILQGNSPIETIAISMMPGDNGKSIRIQQDKIITKIKNYKSDVKILFFNAKSKGCWINL